MSRHDQHTLDQVNQAKERDFGGNPTRRAERAFRELLRDLEPELRKLSRRYYINGSNDEDVIQEGRIGVWKAIQDFDCNGGMSWRNFCLGLCVKRHLITQIAAANRKKFDPLNNSVSFDAPVNTGDDDGEQSLGDFIQDDAPPPIQNYITKEELAVLEKRIVKRLTQLEYAIYQEYTFDESYKDIAAVLGILPKVVDNGLMRVRKKAWECYQDYIREQMEASDPDYIM